MAISKKSGRVHSRYSADLSFLTSIPYLNSELRFSRGFVDESGEIGGFTFVCPMEGTMLVAETTNDAMEPRIPKGCMFSIDTETPIFLDGDAVVARVASRVTPYRSGERLLEAVEGRIDLFWKFFPERVNDCAVVLRVLGKDHTTGRASLKALSPGYPTIVEDDSTSIEIFGRARPDLERASRFERNGERHKLWLGYRVRPEPPATAWELAQNSIHEALKSALTEEAEFPESIAWLARELSDPEMDKPPLRAFRDDESAVQSFPNARSYFPVDRLCARMFRSGQLSLRVEGGKRILASFALLKAEELLSHDITKLITNFGPSPLYTKLISEYREAEDRIRCVHPPGPMPIVVLCARMFRAGQLSEPYHSRGADEN